MIMIISKQMLNNETLRIPKMAKGAYIAQKLTEIRQKCKNPILKNNNFCSKIEFFLNENSYFSKFYFLYFLLYYIPA